MSGITKVNGIQALGTIHVCTEFNDKPSRKSGGPSERQTLSLLEQKNSQNDQTREINEVFSCLSRGKVQKQNPILE